MEQTDIAKRIKEIRVRKKITQDDGYEATGINIARIESGKCNPTIETIERICDYYDITLSELFRFIRT